MTEWKMTKAEDKALREICWQKEGLVQMMECMQKLSVRIATAEWEWWEDACKAHQIPIEYCYTRRLVADRRTSKVTLREKHYKTSQVLVENQPGPSL